MTLVSPPTAFCTGVGRTLVGFPDASSTSTEVIHSMVS